MHAGKEDGAGDVLAYTAADGRVVPVRVVGALPVRTGILQGSLLVDERHFLACYPGEGYRLWLCDYAPYLLREADTTRAGDLRKARAAVNRLRYPEPGVTVETVVARLRLLASVESTYLDMFLVLGGLGMVLGVGGVALVMLRSVAERRTELALLSAVGIPRATVMRLLLGEFGVLAGVGVLAGAGPAWVAIQPAAHASHGGIPWGGVFGVLAAMVGCAVLSVGVASWWATVRYGPGDLRDAA